MESRLISWLPIIWVLIYLQRTLKSCFQTENYEDMATQSNKVCLNVVLPKTAEMMNICTLRHPYAA